MRKTLYVMSALLVFASPVAVHADTLIVEGLNKSQTSAQQRPSRGMSMDAVSSTWGQPRDKRNAVGEPPISRWEYADFVVYFEYSNVIHAVAKR